MTGLRINLVYDPNAKGPCSGCSRSPLCKVSKVACDDFRYFVFTGETREEPEEGRAVSHVMYKRIFRGEFEGQEDSGTGRVDLRLIGGGEQ